jgi:type I thyroxine 5'-deiodinase
VPALNALYERYRDQAAFFVVYIGEAHPSDAWQLPTNLKDNVVYTSPRDLASRTELAEVCVTRLGIKLPAVVDRFDDAVEKAYSGWPDRLYLIDRDGRVAYKSRPGPFGFEPGELEAALKDVLSLNFQSNP